MPDLASTPKSWQRRASPLARQLLGVYFGLVVYASLYPFSGWRSLGLAPFDYLFAPSPPYLTVFDVVTNVLGYFPLGMLVALSVYPRWRGVLAVLAGVLAGTALSASMEAIQTYLPTRVASNLDLVSNAMGALLGAALMAPLTSHLLDRGGLRRLRFLWFDRHAGFLLSLIALWPFAQIFPEPFLFGVGTWPRELWNQLDISMQNAVLAWVPAALQAGAGSSTVDLSGIWEAWVTGLNVAAAGLLATLAMRAAAPRRRLLLGLLVATIAIKGGATFLQSQSGLPFEWLTGGAQLGILAGCVVAALTCRLPHAWRSALAVGMLSVALLLVNLVPLNPYYSVVLADWRQGRYLHFNGLAQWLAWIWPYGALLWLAASAERAWVRRRAPPR